MSFHLNPQDYYVLMFCHQELLRINMELKVKRRKRVGQVAEERIGSERKTPHYLRERLVYQNNRNSVQRTGTSIN